MATGRVLMFKTDKGYGFIKPDDGSANVYVHVSSLEGIQKLEEGQAVRYEIQTQDDKISAVQVSVIGE